LARIERDNAIKNQIKTYRSRIGEQPVEEQKDVDEFVVGQVYQDASGNRARYLGNGEFEELN
jgi:lysozyme family protein